MLRTIHAILLHRYEHPNFYVGHSGRIPGQLQRYRSERLKYDVAGDWRKRILDSGLHPRPGDPRRPSRRNRPAIPATISSRFQDCRANCRSTSDRHCFRLWASTRLGGVANVARRKTRRCGHEDRSNRSSDRGVVVPWHLSTLLGRRDESETIHYCHWNSTRDSVIVGGPEGGTVLQTENTPDRNQFSRLGFNF